MDVFEWVKDIEELYENLINNAKDINLKDIEEFREQQRTQFESFLEKKNELVNNALISLTTSGDTQIKEFEAQIDKAIEKIEVQFQEEISNLHKLIIDEMGLDF
jgi:predicted DNA-binding transcriptional regulator